LGNSLFRERVAFFPSDEQAGSRRGPAVWQQRGSSQSRFSIQVSEYFPDHRRIFSAIAPGIALPPTSLWSNAGDYFDRATAFAAGFNINVKHPFQASPHGAYFWFAQVIGLCGSG